MAYQLATTAVTLNDLEVHSPVAYLFKCNPSNICAAFNTISTDVCSHRFSALAELLVKLAELRPMGYLLTLADDIANERRNPSRICR